MATETSTAPKPTPSLRRLIVRGLSAIVVIIGGYLLLRVTSVRGLPEIEPPFDSTSEVPIKIRDEENAFTYYSKAIKQRKGTEPLTMKSAYSSWAEVDQTQLSYVDENPDMLATWFEGTQRDRAFLDRPPSGIAEYTLAPEVVVLRSIFRAASLRGYRYEHEGDVASAWKWYRAGLRSSRHLSQSGVVNDRLVAIALYVPSSQSVIKWAEHPKVDVTLLRKALKDVLELDNLTAPPKSMLGSSYFEIMKILDNSDLRTRSYTIGQNLITPNPTFLQNLGQKATLISAPIRREPERSKRVVRLVYANWLAAIDLPLKERGKRIRINKTGELTVFAPDPGEQPVIPLDRLCSWFDSTVYARQLLLPWRAIEAALTREELARSAMIIHLAEQIYLREHGKLPASPEDLVGPYLKELPSGYDSTGK